MPHLIVRLYRAVFARKILFRFNQLLFRCSLGGMGMLNYESDRASGEQWLLTRHLKGKLNGVVLDVGANVGDYSAMVMRFHSQARIYAFEPHPNTFARLQDRFQSTSCTPIQAAVGDTSGSVTLYDYNVNGSSHASLYPEVIERLHRASSVGHEVLMLTLDDFVRDSGIDRIQLLKIDVEGNELKVLQGLANYLAAGKVAIIHFEFNEMNVLSRVFFHDFWKLLSNYELYRLLPAGMVRIERYSPVFCEVFAYQNIVAFLKAAR